MGPSVSPTSAFRALVETADCSSSSFLVACGRMCSGVRVERRREEGGVEGVEGEKRGVDGVDGVDGEEEKKSDLL